MEACIEKILNVDISDEKERPFDSLNINPELPISENRVHEIYERNYVLPKRSEIPMINAEHQPFSVVLRRLSCLEKNILRKLLNNFLEKKVLRVSEFEYSSPII